MITELIKAFCIVLTTVIFLVSCGSDNSGSSSSFAVATKTTGTKETKTESAKTVVPGTKITPSKKVLPPVKPTSTSESTINGIKFTQFKGYYRLPDTPKLEIVKSSHAGLTFHADGSITADKALELRVIEDWGLQDPATYDSGQKRRDFITFDTSKVDLKSIKPIEGKLGSTQLPFQESPTTGEILPTFIIYSARTDNREIYFMFWKQSHDDDTEATQILGIGKRATTKTSVTLKQVIKDNKFSIANDNNVNTEIKLDPNDPRFTLVIHPEDKTHGLFISPKNPNAVIRLLEDHSSDNLATASKYNDSFQKEKLIHLIEKPIDLSKKPALQKGDVKINPFVYNLGYLPNYSLYSMQVEGTVLLFQFYGRKNTSDPNKSDLYVRTVK